jgi:hypothetical protein
MGDFSIDVMQYLTVRDQEENPHYSLLSLLYAAILPLQWKFYFPQ